MTRNFRKMRYGVKFTIVDTELVMWKNHCHENREKFPDYDKLQRYLLSDAVLKDREIRKRQLNVIQNDVPIDYRDALKNQYSIM